MNMTPTERIRNLREGIDLAISKAERLSQTIRAATGNLYHLRTMIEDLVKMDEEDR